MVAVAFTGSQAFRILILLEIFFSIGFIAARVWIRRANPFQYLSLMAFALILYSFAAASGMIVKYDYPLTWRTPIVFVAATVACFAVVRESLSHTQQTRDEIQIEYEREDSK